MELTLSKLPWWGQLGAFVVVSAAAVFGFWYLYVADVQADIDARRQRLTMLRADVARGVATARRLPEFQTQVTELEQRLESLRAVLPEQKDVADILRRVQGLATQSNLTIQGFTPQAAKQQPLYAELPFKLRTEGTFHNLGYFFDRVSKFPRIINIGEISIKAKPNQEPNATIVAELVATTFVLQEAAKGAAAPGGAGSNVPKQPSVK
jgi:type IV pilus assembly protein PilO